MNRLYKKNELSFSLVWITAYILLTMASDKLSLLLGTEKLITLPVHAFLALFLFFWIKRHGLSEKYGLCAFKGNIKEYLCFTPLLLILATNMLSGFALTGSPAEAVLHVLSMLCVGFLEEVIFRGFLFKAICRDSIRQAVLISSITFGIGHIVNLLSGQELLPTLLQIAYACAIGFLFTILFYRGKSLCPCIVTHGIFNALAGFGTEVSPMFRIVDSVVLCVIPTAYALWILKGYPQNSQNNKD